MLYLLRLPPLPLSVNLPRRDGEIYSGNGKHFTSSFYLLLGSSVTYELPNISHHGKEIQTAIDSIRSTITCNRLRKTRYKILHSVSRLSPRCIKCHSDIGTYFLCFREFKPISRFRTRISEVISGIFEMKI